MPASRMTQREVAERRAQVLKSRAAGMDWGQIARTVPGVKDAAAAAQDHRRALAGARELRALAGDEGAGALELELQRLDAAALAVEGVLRTAAADPDAHDRVLRAVDRIARLSERRSELLGLGQAPAGARAGGGSAGGAAAAGAGPAAGDGVRCGTAWRRARGAGCGIARVAAANPGLSR